MTDPIAAEMAEWERAERVQVWERTPSGIVVPAPKLLVPSHLRDEAPTTSRIIRGVDLFAGCGGFSLGMQQAGIDVIAALEWNEWAVMTYLSNLGSVAGCAMAYVSDADKARLAKALKKEKESQHSGWIGRHNQDRDGSGCRAMVMGDATVVTGEMIRAALAAIGIPEVKIDVVFGGPPCQGMSKMGKQNVADPRNNLVLEFVRIADELGADVFMMENVPPLLTETKFKPLFEELVRRAHAAGFTVTANVLDAVNYGVPQYRRRAFVVGTRGDANRREFTFAMPTHWSFVQKPGAKPSSFLDRDQKSKVERRARRKKGSKRR